jgi:maleylpyruvate isomerase
MDHYPDGPAAAADLSARIAVATEAVTATAAGLTDAQAREPSRLPGWSRGHVLTHLARNADSLRNLLIWARTRVETPQYASIDEREAGIIAGAGRPAAELRADIEATGAAFAAEAASLRAADWDATVRGLRGAGHPAWYTLWRRLTEVEIHHVDLGTGYRPADWPAAFSSQLLARLAVELRAPNVPRVTLHASGTGASYAVGPADPGAGENHVPAVSGPAAEVAAWLIGRDDGAGLRVQPPGPLPEMPPW